MFPIGGHSNIRFEFGSTQGKAFQVSVLALIFLFRPSSQLHNIIVPNVFSFLHITSFIHSSGTVPP